MIVLIVGTVMYGIISVASNFREPPGLDPFFTLLMMGIIYAVFETLHQLQKKMILRKASNFWMFTSSALVGTLLFLILFYFYKWLDHFILKSEPPMLQHMVFAVLIGLSLSTVLGLILLTFNWRNQFYISHIQNEEFKKEIIKANLSILKNQLDPHFMFNNFNTLYYLIDEDSKLAQQFLKNIAAVYRYILQNNEEALIPISQEFEMAKQYLVLIKERYKNALQVHDTIDEALLRNKSLPPLVLQQLIENAVKHNRIDENSPLHLYLEADASYFIVKNNYNPKITEHTTGTGLENIKKRYNFLTKQKVHISQNDSEFSVAIPLIPTSNEY
ncbi:histidine kinase [Aquimarina gracilis]